MKFFGIIVVFFPLSCVYEPLDKRLLIVNETGGNIAIYWNSDTIPKFPSINDTEVYLRAYSIKSHDSLQAAEYNADWPEYLENSRNKMLNLFVYSVDTLKKYKNIDTLNSKKIYKRLEYSKTQLEGSNWRVVIKD